MKVNVESKLNENIDFITFKKQLKMYDYLNGELQNDLLSLRYLLYLSGIIIKKPSIAQTPVDLHLIEEDRKQ